MAEKRTSTRPPKSPSAPPRRPSAPPGRQSTSAQKRATPAPRRPSTAIQRPPQLPRKETLEVDMSWMEGDESAERLLIEAIKVDAKGKSIAPGPRRSTKSMPAVRKSATNVPQQRSTTGAPPRVMPPSLTGASARRETLQVRADWLIEEDEVAEEPAKKRASKPPPAAGTKRRVIPPPLPREDKD